MAVTPQVRGDRGPECRLTAMPFGFAAWFLPFDESNVRTPHAAAVLTTADPTRSKFSVLSCLPTAPALPMVTNESFGTFSFYSSSPASYGLPYFSKCGAET